MQGVLYEHLYFLLYTVINYQNKKYIVVILITIVYNINKKFLEVVIMLKIIKSITDIKEKQQQIEDRLNKKTTTFNKEWNKWGKMNQKTGKKLP